MTWYKEDSNNNYNQKEEVMEVTHEHLVSLVDQAVQRFRLTDEIADIIQNADSLDQIEYLSERMTNADEDVQAALQARREELEEEDTDNFLAEFGIGGK